ncbi:MAG TPA: glycoside hydrolase family 32 protein [Chitinophagaceae bacterium]|jgi:fructan beta-fructosidase|nr:glycoside hydrolase family 32 protein [Chitinophagaceae bacterium]
MYQFRYFLQALALFILDSADITAQVKGNIYNEPHRPQVHFTPKEKWMNDPNGMLYHKGIYHLFYQYYPDSTVWGPMHWGHATSKDMIHWKHQPIALYPDSLGYIFSGSAVVDIHNTSGFGKNGKPPLVAIFTHHDPKREAEGKTDYQNQSLAYSIDDGMTWVKYANNPVIKSPGIKDFRDPKVMWFEKGKKWIMTLAASNRIIFYSSKNLKDWIKESEFGENAGAHGGVWECPDLFTLDYGGKTVWILIVNLNPGGPNKGSATQYFLGDFDGKSFLPLSTETKWLDYGPDEYAGVTWSNTGKRRLFLGWMSNWLYANVVPTERWRSAMTIPRELKLIEANNTMRIVSTPVKELASIKSNPILINNVSLSKKIDISRRIKNLSSPSIINLSMDSTKDISIILSNNLDEELIIGFDKKQNEYFIDRTRSGKTNFQPDFAARHFAPRFTTNPKMEISLLIDISSVELFADGGLTVMTEIFFPSEPFNQVSIQSTDNALMKHFEYIKLNNIWK